MDLRAFPIGHVGPYEVFAPFNPFQVLTLPSEQGIPAGRTEFNTGFWLDPHNFVKQGLTNGTSVQLLGKRTIGKTGTAQALALRNSALKAADTNIRRRSSADDTRRNAGVGEYKKWAETMGGKYTDLSSYRLNPLDHRMGMNIAEQQYVVRTLLQMSSHRALKTNERTVLLCGLKIMSSPELAETSSLDALTALMSTLTLQEYTAFIKRRTQELIDSLGEHVAKAKLEELHDRKINLSPSSFRTACQSVTEMLVILLEEYGAVFGPSNSLYEVLTASVVALDFSGLDDETIPLVEMLLWMWRNSAARRNDHKLMAHWEIHDENWKPWERIGYGTNMINHLKKIRASGCVICKIQHYPSDSLQVGPAGSRERDLALTGLRETDIWFIGQMPRSEHDMLQNYVNLPRRYLNQLPSMGVGEFIVKIGDILPVFRMHFDMSALELEMTFSNKATFANT